MGNMRLMVASLISRSLYSGCRLRTPSDKSIREVWESWSEARKRPSGPRRLKTSSCAVSALFAVSTGLIGPFPRVTIGMINLLVCLWSVKRNRIRREGRGKGAHSSQLIADRRRVSLEEHFV